MRVFVVLVWLAPVDLRKLKAIRKIPSGRNPAKPVGTASVISFKRDQPEATTPMNFKAPKAFRREFKPYAVQNGMSMVEVLQKSFRAFREARSR